MDEKNNNLETDSGVDNQTPEQDTQEQQDSDFMTNPDIVAYIEKQTAEGIKKALQGNAPKANTTSPTEQEIKRFEKMTYKERLNLFNSDPQSYNKLSKGIV